MEDYLFLYFYENACIVYQNNNVKTCIELPSQFFININLEIIDKIIDTHTKCYIYLAFSFIVEDDIRTKISNHLTIHYGLKSEIIYPFQSRSVKNYGYFEFSKTHLYFSIPNPQNDKPEIFILKNLFTDSTQLLLNLAIEKYREEVTIPLPDNPIEYQDQLDRYLSNWEKKLESGNDINEWIELIGGSRVFIRIEKDDFYSKIISENYREPESFWRALKKSRPGFDQIRNIKLIGDDINPLIRDFFKKRYGGKCALISHENFSNSFIEIVENKQNNRLYIKEKIIPYLLKLKNEGKHLGIEDEARLVSNSKVYYDDVGKAKKAIHILCKRNKIKIISLEKKVRKPINARGNNLNTKPEKGNIQKYESFLQKKLGSNAEPDKCIDSKTKKELLQSSKDYYLNQDTTTEILKDFIKKNNYKICYSKKKVAGILGMVAVLLILVLYSIFSYQEPDLPQFTIADFTNTEHDGEFNGLKCKLIIGGMLIKAGDNNAKFSYSLIEQGIIDSEIHINLKNKEINSFELGKAIIILRETEVIIKSHEINLDQYTFKRMLR